MTIKIANALIAVVAGVGGAVALYFVLNKQQDLNSVQGLRNSTYCFSAALIMVAVASTIAMTLGISSSRFIVSPLLVLESHSRERVETGREDKERARE